MTHSVLASLKIKANDDLVAQLDKQLAKPAPTEVDEKKTVKFVFAGDGDYITVAGIYVISFVEIAVEVGRATSLKKGSGVLWTTYVAHGLSGGYRLKFEGGKQARLFEEGEQIWIWKGELEGLEGSHDVVLDGKALITYANFVFPGA